MQTCSRAHPAPLLLALALVGAAPAAAVDAGARIAPPHSAEAFASARDALRMGVRTYNSGDKAGAVRALEFAADQGDLLALWKLGRMYADGDGVPRDDARAFDYFSRIADENADEAPGSDRSSIVASAFVALGAYSLDGISNSDIKANPERAVELFQYAAAYFGNAAAQFNLARLYLEGRGTDRDVRQAARWFNLAAEKGHHLAQAILGHMLVTGEGGIGREPARGLALLTLARRDPGPTETGWIDSLYKDALDLVSEPDRRTATALLEQYRVRRR